LYDDVAWVDWDRLFKQRFLPQVPDFLYDKDGIFLMKKNNETFKVLKEIL